MNRVLEVVNKLNNKELETLKEVLAKPFGWVDLKVIFVKQGYNETEAMNWALDFSDWYDTINA